MTRSKRAGRGAWIPVIFTARERTLLLEETLADPQYADRLVEKKGCWVARFILGYLAAAANHTPRAKLRKELDALYDRIEPLSEGESSQARDAF